MLFSDKDNLQWKGQSQKIEGKKERMHFLYKGERGGGSYVPCSIFSL